MPTYIALMKYTEQGIKAIKGSPQRREDAVEQLEALGGQVTAIYSVMGEYDTVAILDCPNDEVAMTFLLALSSLGNVRTTTLKAFTREEFEEIVKRLS